MVNVFGREISTPILLTGSAIGIGGVLWYRHNKKNQQTTQQPNDQTGTVPEGIDPNTGQPFSAEYGAYTYEPYGSGFGPSGLDSYAGDYGGSGAYSGMGYYGAGGVPYQVQTQATTNAQWSEAAVSALTAQGYSGMQVLAALGLFLTGGALSADQASIVRAAIAAEGYPPQGPTTINQAPVNGTPRVFPPNTTVKVPNVIGQKENRAAQIISAAGLHPHGTPIKPGTTGFTVKKQSPVAGKSVARGSTVSISG